MMPDHCKCGAEINDATEICPVCGANIRAIRAEQEVEMLRNVIEGWRKSADSLDVEVARLSKREGNTCIELCYSDGENPFAREILKHIDFGVSDNTYVVESQTLKRVQAEVNRLRNAMKKHRDESYCYQPEYTFDASEGSHCVDCHCEYICKALAGGEESK